MRKIRSSKTDGREMKKVRVKNEITKISSTPPMSLTPELPFIDPREIRHTIEITNTCAHILNT